MLKRLKNIENKNEQQLDLIGRINNGETKSIKFRGKLDEKIKKLRERVNKEDNGNKNKNPSLVKIMQIDDYDFKDYGKLVDFGNNLYNNKLSLDKAKNEQDRSLKLINSLKKVLAK